MANGIYRGTHQPDEFKRLRGGDLALASMYALPNLGASQTASGIPTALGAEFFQKLNNATTASLGRGLYGDLLKEAGGDMNAVRRIIASKNVKGPWDYIRKGITNEIPRARGVGGIGALLALYDAAQELDDSMDPSSVNWAEAGGRLGGTLLGTTLGGVIGSALIPLPGVGWAIGAGIGGMMGGKPGQQTARAIYKGFDPEVERRRQIRQELRNQEMLALRLKPLQDMIAKEQATRNAQYENALLAQMAQGGTSSRVAQNQALLNSVV